MMYPFVRKIGELFKEFIEDERGFFTFPLCHWSSSGTKTYVNSVQAFSITIASGSASNTATISAVGANAFIIWDGLESTVTTNSAQGGARVTLTNSTTVTATRNTSAANTVTVKGYVVDATSSLVVSVQFGTITIASAGNSGTATITSTNANYTAINYLGASSSSTTYGPNNYNASLSFSGTTVTATRVNTPSSTLTVSFVVIEFQSAACNSTVQAFSKSWGGGGTSSTQAVTSVTAANTMVIYAGQQSSSSSANNSEQYGTLTNGTTYTVNVNTSGTSTLIYNFYVVEFISAVIAQAAQRGTITLTAATSNTATITAVGSKAIVNYLGFTTSNSTSSFATNQSDLVLTNSTTVTLARNTGTNNVTGSYEAIDFA